MPAYGLLLAYAVVGLGAAAYSPAKYGILTEYLPHRQLVVANGWIEGLTVASIILGTVLGGAAHQRRSLGACCSRFDMPYIDTGIDTPAEAAIARDRRGLRDRRALQPRASPTPASRYSTSARNPVLPGRATSAHLLRDAVARQARPDLARRRRRSSGAPARRCSSSSSKWARRRARLPLDQGGDPAGRHRVGIAIGAVHRRAASCRSTQSVHVLPLGIAMGVRRDLR